MATTTHDGAGATRFWSPQHIDPAAQAESIRQLLALARKNLAMEVGYFGTFEGGNEIYQVVEGGAVDGLPLGPREGAALALDQTLCWQVVTGATGNLIPDARRDTVTRDLSPVTDSRVRAYLGVPVHRGDELLGMLCLVSSQARPDLGAQDMSVLRLFADIVALQLTQDAGDARHIPELAALQQVMATGSAGLTVVFQPVARIDACLRDGSLRTRSVEALSRFDVKPAHPVEFWFDLAWRHGLGLDLELLAIERAFAALDALPDPIRLAVNASPETVCSSRLRELIPRNQAHRITVELTEHMLVADYSSLRPGLARLRETGVSLAIDDLGTGSSNLQHIIELEPDLLKVDLSITDGVERDSRRRALVSALVAFTKDTGMNMVAEGIERVATARELDRLGVAYGQGFWLSRGLPADGLPDLARRTA